MYLSLARISSSVGSANALVCSEGGGQWEDRQEEEQEKDRREKLSRRRSPGLSQSRRRRPSSASERAFSVSWTCARDSSCVCRGRSGRSRSAVSRVRFQNGRAYQRRPPKAVELCLNGPRKLILCVCESLECGGGETFSKQTGSRLSACSLVARSSLSCHVDPLVHREPSSSIAQTGSCYPRSCPPLDRVTRDPLSPRHVHVASLGIGRVAPRDLPSRPHQGSLLEASRRTPEDLWRER